jgi:hypothetical protein
MKKLEFEMICERQYKSKAASILPCIEMESYDISLKEGVSKSGETPKHGAKIQRQEPWDSEK